jgi:hypothetical protein
MGAAHDGGRIIRHDASCKPKVLQASGVWSYPSRNPSSSLALHGCWQRIAPLWGAARQKPPDPESESFELKPLARVPDFEASGSLDLEIAGSLLQANDRLPMGFFFFSTPCGLVRDEKRSDRSLEPR